MNSPLHPGASGTADSPDVSSNDHESLPGGAAQGLFARLQARWRALPLFWRFQLAGWAVFISAYTLFKSIVLGSIKLAVVSTLLMETLAFLLTLAMYRYYRSLPPTMSSGSVVWRVLLVCLGAMLIDVIWFQIVRATFFESRELILPGIRGGIAVAVNRFMIYACWSLLFFWIRSALAHLAATSAANAAQLQALRAQLNPHFLFNALNSIVAEADDNPRAVKAMARELASYLRYSLAHRHSERVSLAAEIEAMEHYLNVEKARFEDRLNFTFETTPEALATQVPGFFLQPLVENAVKHGLQTSAGPMRILVRAACTNGTLRIEVGNTGEWRNPAPQAGSHGFGLESIRGRLALLYASHHRFDIEHGNGWVNVTIEVPRA
jgi:two-component system, LytTR family, sensor kinase